MGLIKAIVGSTSSVIGDQFKEYVTCPETRNDVIIQRGVVHHGSANTNPSEGVISKGSVIVVPKGMAMMIVDNGKITEFSSEEGEFTYDNSTEPSIFTGGVWNGIKDSIKKIGSRITFGGATAKDQRVYYVNIKMIPGLTFGSQQSEIVSDPNYGSVEITYNGEYSIKVDDPATLVFNVVGSMPGESLTFNDIFSSEAGNILKSKFAQKVSEAIAQLMIEKNISFNAVQAYKSEVTDKMNTLLNNDWHENYGIVVTDVALRVNASESSKERIAQIDQTKAMGNVYANNMAGTMAAASAEAMKNAASNSNGAMTGFMGMGFAQNQGANMMNAVNNTVQSGVVGAVESPAKFCSQCGTKNVDAAKFCQNCGKEL